MNELTITLDFDAAADLTRQHLIQSMENIEYLNDYSMVSVWDALNEVVAYYSTPAQLEEMELRQVPPHWFDTVIQYDKDRMAGENT